MSTERKPAENGTALAERSKKEIMADLPEDVKAGLALREIQRNVQVQIANKSWGQALDVPTRHAVAEYCARFGLDPVEDIDVLGGRPYRKANYYLKRLAALSVEGLVDWHKTEHVEADARLADLAKQTDNPTAAQWAKEEGARRTMLRIQYGIPDKATGAVVFTVKLKEMREPVSAANWCGGGTRKNDPVGDDRPQLTAETRAARRCLRAVMPHLTGTAGHREQIMEAHWETIEEKVGDAMAEDARLQAEQDTSRPVAGSDRRIAPGSASAPIADGSAGYGDSQPDLDLDREIAEEEGR